MHNFGRMKNVKVAQGVQCTLKTIFSLSNAVGTGPKAHQTPSEGLEFEELLVLSKSSYI